jgi:hypothetical protein
VTWQPNTVVEIVILAIGSLIALRLGFQGAVKDRIRDDLVSGDPDRRMRARANALGFRTPEQAIPRGLPRRFHQRFRVARLPLVSRRFGASGSYAVATFGRAHVERVGVGQVAGEQVRRRASCPWVATRL